MSTKSCTGANDPHRARGAFGGGGEWMADARSWGNTSVTPTRAVTLAWVWPVRM